MKYISTRDDKKMYSAEQVLNFGLAPDGGLFIPNEITKFSNNQINALKGKNYFEIANFCLLYTSPSPRDLSTSRMPSSA